MNCKSLFSFGAAALAGLQAWGNEAVVPRASAGNVEGAAVEQRVTGRMAWLDSKAGTAPDRPTAPFTAIRVDQAKRTLSILGRELTLGEDGLPKRYRSFFNGTNTKIGGKGRNILSDGFAFACAKPEPPPGEEEELDIDVPVRGKLAFVSVTPTRVAWRAEAKEGKDLVYAVDGELQFDGFATFRITPARAGGGKLTFGLPADVARFAMGLGLEGGDFPERINWKWSASRLQDAEWMGDVNGGLMIRLKGADYSAPLINLYYRWKPLRKPGPWGDGAVTIEKGETGATFAATGVAKAGEPYVFDLYLTPFRTIDLKRHLDDRYAHLSQRVENVDFKALAAQGVTVVNFHHNTVWNPYINYPYNEDGGPLLQQAAKDAHAAGIRLKVYYTTREITQNMPEFKALAALGGEVIFRRDRRIPGWPDTNPWGPDKRLVELLGGDDFLPAWRETINFPKRYPPRPDLAVITNPDSPRWSNFYLAGLEHLVRDYGVDGTYVDDSALDNAAMLRARRILDADGNTGRRVDMHMWNHFNGYVGNASAVVIYMGLFPFIDRLWCGEGYRQKKSAAYWLVERSGIPFGLLSEQLEDVSYDKGLVYAMQAGRWAPCAKKPGPRPPEWALAEQNDLATSEMIGWWDPANPVRVIGSDDVKATVYRGKTKSVVAVANFGDAEANVKLVLKGTLPGLTKAAVEKPLVLAPHAGVQLMTNMSR